MFECKLFLIESNKILINVLIKLEIYYTHKNDIKEIASITFTSDIRDSLLQFGLNICANK